MVESSLPGSFAIIVCPLVTRITSRVADNHPYSFYLQAGIISRIHPLPLRWNEKSDWYSRVWSDKLILFESWVDENRNECPFVFSFRISIALTGDPFVDLSIFHPRWHLVGSRQKAAGTQNFRAHAYGHTLIWTYTSTYDSRAHGYTHLKNVSSICGEPGYIPLVSIIPSPPRSVLCANRERSTESDVPLLRLLKWPPKRRLVSIPVR